MLAAGKGVIIAQDEREARAAIDVFFGEKRFGETEVVLEEFLEGEELSLLALCDGERAVPLAPAQDYKRIFDGDEGPNTGGMGSYSPVPGIDADRAQEIAERVHQPIVDELRRRGTPFHGILYAGLMMGADGSRRCSSTTPASAIRRRRPCCRGCAPTSSTCSRRRAEPGGLAGVEPEWTSDWAVTVVLASGGYPESSSSGDVITGLWTRSRRRGVPRGYGRAGRRDRDRRRPRAGRDRARRPRRARRATAPTRRPSGSTSTAGSCGATSPPALWIGSEA